MNDEQKPTSKHDGRLGKESHYIAGWARNFRKGKSLSIADGCDDHVVLSPKEALSLLAWLEQERATLEQLAKEQET